MLGMQKNETTTEFDESAVALGKCEADNCIIRTYIHVIYVTCLNLRLLVGDSERTVSLGES